MIQQKQKIQRKLLQQKTSEPSLDKPNPKDMKIKLPLSKSDKIAFQTYLDYHTKMTEFPGRNKKIKYQNL